VRRILGVNFSDKILEATIINVKFRVAEPVKSEKVNLPDKKEESESFILEILKKWKTKYSPAGVVVGLPLHNFSYQLIDMPAMNRSDLRNALSFELEKYLPLPVDEYIFDFLSIPDKKNRTKVLVFSIRRDVVNKTLKYVKEADIDILSIKCSTLVAFSGFLEIVREKNVKGLFVNVTDDFFEIIGLDNSMPVFIKNFPVNIDLSLEIEKLLVLYPGTVFFLGNPELSLTKNLDSRKYHLSVSNALAFSELKKSSLNLNFLTQEYIKKSIDYYPYILGSFAAVSVIVFLFTGIAAYYKDLHTLKSLEAKISRMQANASGMIEAKNNLDTVQSDMKVLIDFRNRSNVSIKVLSELSKVLPEDTWLINISIDDKGKIEMEGFTEKTSVLVVALENSKSFKNITFSSPIIKKNGEERFSLKLETERP
jgi:hypothetical protein